MHYSGHCPGKAVMKIARRVAKFSPWAVAAVMALEIAHPAIAQMPRPMNAARMAAVPMTVTNDDAAINVQIAWLGDPALFCCNLVAKDTPEGMELVGYVPNEAVRQKALHIAKTICGDKVVNHLRLQAGMPIPLTRPAAPTELAPQASTVLAEALGEKVLGLLITSPTAGRIEIAGSVPTAEDKLLISKSLKKLNGCIFVVNKVNATGSSESAAMVSNVPLMKTMPKPEPEPEPVRPFVMTMPDAVQKPMKPVEMSAGPVIIHSEPKAIIPPPPPTKVVAAPKVAPLAVAKSEPVVVAKNEPIAIPIKEPAPELKGPAIDLTSAKVESVKEVKLPDIKPIEPIIEKDAPKLGMASVSDLPLDVTPKATTPIIVPPPIVPVVVEPVPVVKNDPPKTIVVEPPVVVKKDLPKPAPVPTPTSTSTFNPLRIKTDTKPVEVVKATEPETPKLTAPEPVWPKPTAPIEMPKVIDLQPGQPTMVISTPKKMDLTPESPKKLDLIPEAPKPEVEQPKTIVLIPELPKPALNVAPAPKLELSSKPNAGTASVSDLTIKDVVKETPKRAEPKVVPAPKSEPTISAKAGTSSVTDLPVKEIVKETPKAVAPIMLPAPVVESTVQPKAGTASVCDLPVKEVVKETPKQEIPVVAPAPKLDSVTSPKMGSASVSDLMNNETVKDPPVVKETPKPVLPTVAAPEVKLTKSDRFVPPAPPVLPAKTMAYETTPPAQLPAIKNAEPVMVSTSVNDNKISGIIRQPGSASAALDSSTVRKAIEDICRGSAENISVRETAGRQLTVGMKVTNQGEWDRLYTKVKNLPEVAGYSVIYNVSVEPVARSVANMEPMRGIIRTNATSPIVEGDEVKKAIENLCAGRADDIAIKATGKQQVTVAMKVRSTGEWDKLYKQIKALPEVAGYAVIYNVCVK